ncbi:MAG: adenylyl-sulfate kinase [Bacteroidetes bacterium]|nr:adenylyl-sulfate kinase [Bacteroidota bacterium]
MTENNIHPVFEQLLQREEKEVALNQRAVVLWMTGLSGSGKSTIAIALERKLHDEGYFTKVLDGDNVRTGINSNLGFSDEDRIENIRRIAEVSKLFVDNGIITINSFVSPTREIRNQARSIIGEDDFIEIYVNASLEVCEARDVKGLYKKVRSGEIKDFTGIDAPFEAPENPEVEVKTDDLSVEESVEIVMGELRKKIELKN